MSCLDSLLGYSTGEFKASQLIVRCLVPWINHLPPVCWSTFWKCKFDIMDNSFFIWYVQMCLHIY